MPTFIPPDVRHFWFLDNSIFRILCSTPGGEAIKRFNRELGKFKFVKNESTTAMKLTPFTVLEAIGVVVPNPPTPNIPKELLNGDDGLEIIDFVLAHGKAYYSSRPELARTNLLAKVAEQRSFCQREAIPLFEMCVEHPVQSESFADDIHTFLTFDYAFRFSQYGKSTPTVHAALVPFFFVDDEGRNLSKFRIAKALWDAIYSQMKLSGIPDPRMLEVAHNAMKIKSTRDMVDCELVHYACCGYKIRDDHYRVACFTCDSPDSIVPRISVYKGIIEMMIQMTDEVLRVDVSDMLTSAAGVVVFCDKAGHFVEIVPTGSVKPIG